MNRFSNQKDVIDLYELCLVYIRKLWLIILSGIFFALIAFGYTKLMITPQYQSSAMIYMLGNENRGASSADIQLTTQISNDFQVISKSSDVIEKVIAEANVPYSYGEMCAKVSVSTPANTKQILQFTVYDTDPVVACNLANCMADITAKQIAKVMKTDEPSIIETAKISSYPVSPDIRKNIMMGFMAGAVLILGILTIQFLLDDTIKSEDDIEKYIGVNTIAVLPIIDFKGARSKNKKKIKKSSV